MNANSKLVVQRWQDETALSRFKMIAPLCDGAIDPAKRVQLRREIASANDLSYKTIKRYDNAYQAQGFEGLKPKDRMPRDSKKLPENYDDLLQEAIQLRREVPSRSVDKIITILELENRVAPGRTLRARRTGTRALRYAHTVRVLRGDLRPFVDRHALPLPSFRSWSPRRLPGAKKHQSGLYLPCPAAATDASGDTLFTCCVTIIARRKKKKGLRFSKSQSRFFYHFRIGCTILPNLCLSRDR